MRRRRSAGPTTPSSRGPSNKRLVSRSGACMKSPSSYWLCLFTVSVFLSVFLSLSLFTSCDFLNIFLSLFLFPYTEELRSEVGGSDNVPGAGISAALPVPRSVAPQIDVEKHFLPLELACQSKSARIVVSALDCIQVWVICLSLPFRVSFIFLQCSQFSYI